MLTLCLDRNGNRTKEYVDEVVSLLEGCNLFVELGVGVGATALAVGDKCTCFAIDTFRRGGAISQFSEFSDNLKNSKLKTIIPLCAPAEFAARSFPEDHADLVHIDLFDDEEETEQKKQTVRFIAQAWLGKTKAFVVPKQPVYTGVLDAFSLRRTECNHVVRYAKSGIWSK